MFVALQMFSFHVCCTVCDLNAETLAADILKWLIDFISDLPDTTVLVFYYTSVDVTDGKRYPTPKNKKLMDAVAKIGSVCDFQYKTPEALAKDIDAMAKKEGAKIQYEAAVYLARLCGCSTIMAENEIAKLTAYVNGGEITKDTVDLLCSRQIETTSFDLAKAIARKDSHRSLALLNDLNIEKTEAIAVLYAITASMVDLYRAKVAFNCRKNVSDVVNDFGYAKNVAFRVDNAFRDVNVYSLLHLRTCVQILVETDVAMKSLKTDKWVLLEEAVVRMLNLK